MIRGAPIRAWALALVVGAAACASPATTTRETPAAREEPGPRFAASGFDADELGGPAGYPKGDRTTFYSVPTAVGSHSHLDEIFQGRLVHRASEPSPLRRAANRASRRWTTTWPDADARAADRAR